MGLRRQQMPALLDMGMEAHTLPQTETENGEDVHIGHNALSRQTEVHSEKGQHGGCIVSPTAVGRKEALRETDRGLMGQVQPRARWLLTARRDAGSHRPTRKLKPDVLLAHKQHGDPEGPAQVYIVEIETCIDAIQRPLERARATHWI
jgi:hypothetical protein